MLFTPFRLALAALALAMPSGQAARGPVPLEAADCSKFNMMWGDRPVAYAVKHTRVPLSVGTLDVQPDANGGIRIEKGAGDAYSITACIAASGTTPEEAQRAVDGVTLSLKGNRVEVGPAAAGRSWSVQVVIEAPSGAQVNARTHNGPITIDGVEGRVTASATNGPVTVSGSRGDFDVETQNGPISVDLEGSRWDGRLDARAKNGPLTVRVPERYTSGVEISSSGHSPWTCRGPACGSNSGDRGWGRGSRMLRLGTDPVTVRISTQNGPVSIDTGR